MKDTIFACVIACADTAIKLPLQREFDKCFGSKGYFWLPQLGGAKKLSSPDSESQRENLLQDIRDARAIHSFGLIVLVNHSICGKYKLSGQSFDDPQKEERFHRQELDNAADVIRKEFPDMAVEKHYFLKAEQRMAW